METTEEERTGVLILRAWVEADAKPHLRVRITRTLHGRMSEPLSSASATIDEVCEAVRGWLEELLNGLERLPRPDRR